MIDFCKFVEEIFGFFSVMFGVILNVMVEIEVMILEGFDDVKIWIVLENVMILKFDQSGFEDE